MSVYFSLSLSLSLILPPLPPLLHFVLIGTLRVSLAASSYAIIDEDTHEVLEEIEACRAFFEVYDGAVYLYQVGGRAGERAGGWVLEWMGDRVGAGKDRFMERGKERRMLQLGFTSTLFPSPICTKRVLFSYPAGAC